MAPQKNRARAQAARLASLPRPQPPHTCLSCLAEVELVPFTSTPTVAEHIHSHDSKIHVPCRGSGYGPAQNDGRDDVRVEAINARREILLAVAEKREGFVREMTGPGWPMDLLISMNAEQIIRAETVAEIWKFLADGGDWFATLQWVLADLARPVDASSVPNGMLATIKQLGRRDWLIATRTRLSRLAEKRDDGADLLANLLIAL